MWTEYLRNQGFIPRKRQEIFIFSVISRLALGPTQFPVWQIVGAFFLVGIKWASPKADTFICCWSCAWSYMSTSPNVFMEWCLIKHRDNFTIFYLHNFYTRNTAHVSVWSADYQLVMWMKWCQFQRISTRLYSFRSCLFDCQAALKIRPCYPKAQARAAQCCMFLQRYDECITLCDKMLLASPTDKVTLELRARAVAGKVSLVL
jgi:hypothetical protein